MAITLFRSRCNDHWTAPQLSLIVCRNQELSDGRDEMFVLCRSQGLEKWGIDKCGLSDHYFNMVCLIYSIPGLESLQIQAWRVFAASMFVWVFELETRKDVKLPPWMLPFFSPLSFLSFCSCVILKAKIIELNVVKRRLPPRYWLNTATCHLVQPEEVHWGNLLLCFVLVFAHWRVTNADVHNWGYQMYKVSAQNTKWSWGFFLPLWD